MSLDRGIRLDVSVPDMGQRAGQGAASGSGGQGQPPDAQSRQRFDRALAGAPAPAEDDARTPAQALPPPLARFPTPSLAPPPGAAPREARQLAARLAESVTRLMVGEGAGGGKQVRMTLAEDLLPGVTVTVQTLEGRLQVEFICELESSRLRLVQALPHLAEQLAQRLARAVLVRVTSGDEDDPRPAEALAQGGAPGQPDGRPHA